MSKTAKVELQTVDGQPELTIHVPKGTSLAEMARIQEVVFGKYLPERIPWLPPRCGPCLSGIRILFNEIYENPVAHDLEGMFTTLTTEVRNLSARIAKIEHTAVRSAGPVAEPPTNFEVSF